MAFQEVDYQPMFGRILAGITVAVCAVGVVAMFWNDPWSGVLYVWPVLFVAALAWALFWRPALHVQEHGIVVRNVFRTWDVPWPAIDRIDTKYALTLYTARGRIPVWAAPAPGRHRQLGLSKSDFAGVGESARGAHGSLRPADAVSTPSGNLAQLIRGHWERLRDAGMFDHGVDPEATKVQWNTAVIVVLAALAVATAIGLLI